MTTTATWTVQVNDLVGGWIVTTYPRPLSEHDYRSDGGATRRGVIACECGNQAHAILIAKLLNGEPAGVRRLVMPRRARLYERQGDLAGAVGSGEES